MEELSVFLALWICYSATEADHEEGPVSHISAATAHPEGNSFDSFSTGHSCADCTDGVLISRERLHWVKKSEALESNPARRLWQGQGQGQGHQTSTMVAEFFQWPLEVLKPKRCAGTVTGNRWVIHSLLAVPWPGLQSWVTLGTSDTVWWESEPCRHLCCVPDSFASPSEASVWFRGKSHWGFCRRHPCQANWSGGGWSSESHNAHCVLQGI